MLVGAAATLVHFGVVVALVSHSVAGPLTANLVAWTVAFAVSFLGHWRLSFGSQQAPVWRSARRFFTVSVAGFALNQAGYWLLLRAGWGYAAALAVVLATVAVLTYLTGRFWAFVPQVER